MGFIYAFEASARQQTVLWFLAAVLIGEIATWAAPRRARPWNHILVAVTVTGTLVLMPFMAFGFGFVD
ncbi:hypothetical protein [Streptacidiphilus sp. PAMC 29251]